jgi:hypothetical protein
MSAQPRSRSLLPLLISGLCALLVAQAAARDPRYLAPFFALAGLMFLPAYLARRRMRRLLMSGDVERVLGTWESSIGQVMYPETMAPLMAATAYAAYGWIDASRNALDRAAKGAAWDAALEQRLFVEALLDTFEGDRAAAMAKADALVRLPLPASGWRARRKITRLRAGIGAFARAFAHQRRAGDAKLLVKAAKASPLVHWAMRYAAAVIAIDEGRRFDVPELLAGAPEWPSESAFRAFHDEVYTEVLSVSAARAI